MANAHRGARRTRPWCPLGILWIGLACAATASGQVPGPGTKAAPRVAPAPAVPALAHGLVEDARRLSEAIDRELGPPPRTRPIRLRVDLLTKAAEQLVPALRLRDPAPQRQAVKNVRQAYQPVAEALSQPGLNAPNTQRIAERLGQKIAAIEQAMGVPTPVPVEVRIQRALVREYTAMIGEVDTFMGGLNDRVPEGPQIRAEALALRDAVRQLRRHTAQGAPDRRIIQELAAAGEAQRVLAARVERLNRGRAPGPNVLRLRRIGEILARIQAAASAPQ